MDFTVKNSATGKQETISQQEFNERIQTKFLNARQLGAKTVQGIFQADRDGDGKMEYHGFIYNGNEMELFNFDDKNKNGRLDPDEGSSVSIYSATDANTTDRSKGADGFYRPDRSRREQQDYHTPMMASDASIDFVNAKINIIGKQQETKNMKISNPGGETRVITMKPPTGKPEAPEKSEKSLWDKISDWFSGLKKEPASEQFYNDGNGADRLKFNRAEAKSAQAKPEQLAEARADVRNAFAEKGLNVVGFAKGSNNPRVMISNNPGSEGVLLIKGPNDKMASLPLGGNNQKISLLGSMETTKGASIIALRDDDTGKVGMYAVNNTNGDDLINTTDNSEFRKITPDMVGGQQTYDNMLMFVQASQMNKKDEHIPHRLY